MILDMDEPNFYVDFIYKNVNSSTNWYRLTVIRVLQIKIASNGDRNNQVRLESFQQSRRIF